MIAVPRGRRALALGCLGAAAFAVAAGAHVWARHIEIHRYTLRRATVPVLPAGSAPVRLLHISDIHLMPENDRKLAFLRSLAELEADVVVDTGDNISSPQSVGPLIEAIGPLLRLPGAFVMGSNDLFAPVRKNPARYLLPDARTAGFSAPDRPVDMPVQELRTRLAEHGWRDLTNRRDASRAGDLVIEWVGVDDPHLERDRMPAPDGTRAAAEESGAGAAAELRAEGATESTAQATAESRPQATAESTAQAQQARPALRIGVAHAPYRRVLDALVDDGCDLLLAGHTHGGQLCLPGIGALVTNCDLPRSQAKGLSAWRGVPLHVSGGLGASPFSDMRLANPPEATLLTLLPRPA